MQWLAAGFHGEMHYMAAHGLKRARPAELVPGTVSVITARMDYLPRASADWQARVRAPGAPAEGIVSLYARGRDYHKVLRARLQKLQDRIAAQSARSATACSPTRPRCWRPSWRARSGLGWRGKHTLVLTARRARCSFWARSTSTWPCRPRRRWSRTAAAAAPASTPAPRRPSWRRTGWMRGAASPT
jgi:epoxyqueuosine reductase